MSTALRAEDTRDVARGSAQRTLPPFPWPQAARSLGLLAVAGGSVGLFMALVCASWPLPGYVHHNALAAVERRFLLISMAAGAATPLLAAGLALAGYGRAAVAKVRIAAALLSPLCVLFLVPLLLSYASWHETPLPYLALLSLFALLLERLSRLALENVPSPLVTYLSERVALPARTSQRAALGIVIALAVSYAAYMSHYTLLNHRRFGTSAFDLGIYDNLMFNILRGAPFRSPVLFGPGGGNYIAGHAEFVMVLFAPLYALRPGSETLLVLQAVFFGFAAVPLFFFARTQLPPWSAAVLAAMYLLYAPLHGPQFYDFHWLPLALFFHFALYYAIAQKRTVLAWACVALLFSVREDVAIGLVILGAFLLLTGVRPRFGAALAAASAAWFVVDKFVIMPWAGRWWFVNLYKDLIAEGEEGYGSVVRTVLVNPAYFVTTLLKEAKLTFALHMLAPLAFLPWRGIALALLATLPGFFFTLMTTDYAPTVSIAFQYTTHWIPYLFLSAILALRQLAPLRRRAALFAATAALCCHSYVFGAVMQRNVFIGGFSPIAFTMSPDEQARFKNFTDVAKLLPKDASVAATDNVTPHVSARKTVYNLRDHHGTAEYLLLDRHMASSGTTKRNLSDALKSASYGLVAHQGDFYLLKRGAVSPDTAQALIDLGQPAPGPR